MPTPLDNEVLVMDGWAKGLNNRVRETEAGAAARSQFEVPSSPWLRQALNVDLTSKGHALRRTGYTQLIAGFYHSLWSDPAISFGLCVKDGLLTALTVDDGIVEHPLKAISPYAPVSCCAVNGEVYWSNGTDKGRVLPSLTVAHWGLPVPPQPSLVGSAGGSLYAGRYQVAVTFEDASKEEYGACEPVTIDLDENSSLEVTVGGGWPVEAVLANVYVTRPNGEIFYLAKVLYYPGSVTVQLGDLGTGRVLETLDRQEPPPGQIVREFNGRVYIARRDTVVFTEPLRYGVTRASQGIYMFPSDVTLLEPSTDGVYVGMEGQVVFLSGADPYNVSQIAVSAHSPIPRSSTRVPGERFGTNARHVPLWWGQDGVMVAGLPGGQVQQLTRDRLALPKHQLGAMLLREREGMSQVVSVLRRGEESNNLGASDSVVAEVRRNCVKLN